MMASIAPFCLSHWKAPVRLITAVILLLNVASAPHPLPAQSPAASVTAFRNVRVFDGERVLDSATVIVRDGRIANMGRGIEIPADAAVVEGSGRTLLPGLIDAHTHTRSRDDLAAALAWGVTLHLDMFSDPAIARSLREEDASSAATRASLMTAGIVATAPDGHGTQYALSVPTLSSPTDADTFVAARVAEGSDWIKIIVEDGQVIGREIPTLDSATIAAVVRAAHARGLLAVAHAMSVEMAERAVSAGVDGLMHVWLDAADQAALAGRLRESDVFVVPTLAVTRGRGSAAIPALARAGVPLLAGSDAPNPGTAFGTSLHDELVLLTDAGLPPLEALKAATSAPADAFRLMDRGRIRPGARADLLLVDGDPTTSIDATRAIVGVWKDGVRFDHQPWHDAARAEHAEREAARGRHGPGVISDFEEGTLASSIGIPWRVSSDQRRGGASTAQIRIARGGHNGSEHALEVTGRIVPGRLRIAWAGALLQFTDSPGDGVSIADATGVAFAASGDGRTYEVTFYTPDGPATARFTAGPDWREYRFDWQQFDGLDPSAVHAMSIDAGSPEGSFRILIDDVRLTASDAEPTLQNGSGPHGRDAPGHAAPRSR